MSTARRRPWSQPTRQPNGMARVIDFDSGEGTDTLFASEDCATQIPARDHGFAQFDGFATLGR